MKYYKNQITKEWKREFFQDIELMKVFLCIKSSSKSIDEIYRETKISKKTIRQKILKLKQKNLIEEI